MSKGGKLFGWVCQRDLEGIVAKWAHGLYLCDGRTTNWVKVKNPAYSQIVGLMNCSLIDWLALALQF